MDSNLANAFRSIFNADIRVIMVEYLNINNIMSEKKKTVLL